MSTTHADPIIAVVGIAECRAGKSAVKSLQEYHTQIR